MSSAETQACLARLYTDSAFRRLFGVHVEGALRDYFLSADERRALAELDPAELEDFAGSLAAKRRGVLEGPYDTLLALDEPAMDVYVRRYFDLYPRRPEESFTADITRFGRFIEETLRGDARLRPFACELARFLRVTQEHRQDLASGPPSPDAPRTPRTAKLGLDARPVRPEGVSVERFEFRVSEVARALSSGEDPGPSRGPEQIVFTRRSDGEEPGVMRVSASTADLIELCDGSRTLGEVIAATDTPPDSADFAGARQIVDRLVATGVLKVAAGVEVAAGVLEARAG